HGNMAAVGIETYSRLLSEEIQRMKGEPAGEEYAGPLMELNVSAYIPDEYLPSSSERVLMYKRILNAEEGKLQKLKEELQDRCGPLPAPAETLFETAAVRLEARRHGISEVHQEEESLLIYFVSKGAMKERAVSNMLSQPNLFMFVPGKITGVRF